MKTGALVSRAAARLRLSNRWWIIGPAYLWLALFFLAPFLIVFKISFAEALLAQPPFTALFDHSQGAWSIQATLDNYAFLWSDRLYVSAYLSSFRIAGVATVLCLLIGYPIAYALSRLSGAARSFCLLLVVLPSWTSFLIRIYAWMGILRNNGILNETLLSLGIIDQPLRLLNTEFAVYIGIVYAYLPFMVLPLYANLTRLDHRLLEAAGDLGARPLTAFLRVTLPLSAGGIVAGCMLVFIPAVGEYVIPELLGGAETLMIGKVLWNEFFANRDWPIASAVATLMLLLLLVPILVFHRVQSRDTEAV